MHRRSFLAAAGGTLTALHADAEERNRQGGDAAGQPNGGRGGAGRGLLVPGAGGVHHRPQPHQSQLGQREPGSRHCPAGDESSTGTSRTWGRRSTWTNCSDPASRWRGAGWRRPSVAGRTSSRSPRNASEAMEIVQFGLPLQAGDEVLTTTQDYPRMLMTFRQRERRDGIVLRTVPYPTPPEDLSELTGILERAITPKTKLLLICHTTFTTGQIFPVGEICRMARRHGIETLVDGAHGFAHFPFTRDELDCDYYGTSLHKWLFAPVGTGFLYVRKEKIPNVWPLMSAPTSQDDDIRKFEQIGTNPIAVRGPITEAVTFPRRPRRRAESGTPRLSAAALGGAGQGASPSPGAQPTGHQAGLRDRRHADRGGGLRRADRFPRTEVPDPRAPSLRAGRIRLHQGLSECLQHP